MISTKQAVTLHMSWDLTLARSCYSKKMLGLEGGQLWIPLPPLTFLRDGLHLYRHLKVRCTIKMSTENVK